MVHLMGLEWWVLVFSTSLLFFVVYSRHRAALAWYEAKLNQSYPGRLDSRSTRVTSRT